MTAGITLSCDGHRNDQPCRGFLPTRASQPDEARHVYGKPRGWRALLVPDVPGPNGAARYLVRDLCPAPGHTEELAR